MSNRPQLIAHRGASREFPENTLPAFLRALELGADGLELDVHATRDGVIVVHHDAQARDSSDATGSASRELARLTYDEVRTLRTPGGGQIPCLSDVLEAVHGHADVYVEIKAAEIEAEVVRTIRESPAPERCAVHSFDHRTVKRARALAPELRGGVLLSSYPVDTAAVLTAADATDCWMWWEYIDRQLVETVQHAGGRVVAWTVNDARAAGTLAAFGVDGICSDVLPVVRPAVAGV